jgi:hypothetical protein
MRLLETTYIYAEREDGSDELCSFIFVITCESGNGVVWESHNCRRWGKKKPKILKNWEEYASQLFNELSKTQSGWKLCQ